MVESRSGQRQLSLDDVRDLIDVCWMAKRITEALPELPKNMKPRHVHVIDAIWNLNHRAGSPAPAARVSGSSRLSTKTSPVSGSAALRRVRVRSRVTAACPK